MTLVNPARRQMGALGRGGGWGPGRCSAGGAPQGRAARPGTPTEIDLRIPGPGAPLLTQSDPMTATVAIAPRLPGRAAATVGPCHAGWNAATIDTEARERKTNGFDGNGTSIRSAWQRPRRGARQTGSSKGFEGSRCQVLQICTSHRRCALTQNSTCKEGRIWFRGRPLKNSRNTHRRRSGRAIP